MKTTAFKPEVGKQKTDKLIESDKVDFLTGYIWSNVLLASVKSAFDSKTFLISANAGPHPARGRWLFAVLLLDLVAKRPDAASDGSLYESERRQVGFPDWARTTRLARTCWRALPPLSKAKS